MIFNVPYTDTVAIVVPSSEATNFLTSLLTINFTSYYKLGSLKPNNDPFLLCIHKYFLVQLIFIIGDTQLLFPTTSSLS